jgi:FimV-like protein
MPDGTYILTVSSGGRSLKSEVVSVSDFSGPLNIQIRDDRRRQSPATGVISARRLKHKVPKEAAKAFKKAHSLFESGDMDGSLDFLKRATEVDPEYIEAWNNLGCRLMMKHQLPDALSAFQRALAIDPEAPFVHTNLGIVLMMLGKPGEAEQEARKAAAIDPTDKKARYVLGFSLYLQRQYTDETVKLLRAAAESTPNARIALAHTLSSRGEQEEARTILEKHLRSGQPEAREDAQKLLSAIK